MIYRKTILIIISFLCSVVSFSQIPSGYYDSARDLCGEELRQKLYSIISSHTTLGYSELWTAYRQTDLNDNGKIWDIYSNCNFTLGTDQCGNYNSECDCYNREHTVPQSWFGDATPMKTDLFHVYPTDGWVNNKRGNLPLGKVSNPTYTSGNGSKIGPCSASGYSGTVFEPIDEYKGDLARTYFYMSVCYKNKNLGQTSESMFEGSELKPWALQMLLQWHYNDPVSQKEIDRNNAVYALQHNRNPFIDCPYFAEAIWDGHCDFESCLSPLETANAETYIPKLSASPNPTNGIVSITSDRTINSISIFNILGEKTFYIEQETNFAEINVEQYESGIYFVLAIFHDGSSATTKIIKY
ncbi:MAG: endonuclease [Bacteroidales bacterium]|nr:endonuclease [Bacteroidales bacterium]MBQ5458153.1 endonuclease [Bacteroidales bacterium]MBR6066929.1 endonuclease [Bacteroidales bacterium]